MKSSEFIKKIKGYSLIAFLLPLLTINSCLLLYKILGNIDLYPTWNWNEKKIELLYNSNIYNSFSLSFVDCPKYRYQVYMVTVDNKVMEYGSMDEARDKETEQKIEILRKNNEIKSVIYEFGQNINYKCVKNYKYLYSIINNFNFLEKILINIKKNDPGRFSSIKNPYFYGEVSISRTARYFPATLIFKPFIILSAIFLFFYWKNNLNLFNELKNNNVLNRFSKSFFYLGVLSCLFLIMHASLLGLDAATDIYKDGTKQVPDIKLGLDFDSKLFSQIRKVIIILFIFFELSAQIFLTKNLFRFREQLKKHIRPFILRVKITFVVMVFFATVIVLALLVWGNLSTELKHIFEWNYFSILLIYYFLSRLLWKY